MMDRVTRATKRNSRLRRRLTRVRWHEWSIVRLAGFAMMTVLIGYFAAAILAVQSIDHLLRIVHDNEVEEVIRYGLDQARSGYAANQTATLETLRRLTPEKSITKETLDDRLKQSKALSFLAAKNWRIAPSQEQGPDTWLDRQRLRFKNFDIDFEGSNAAESFRHAEGIYQRYQVVGHELRDNIRPALIKALSITLAIMCCILLIAFIFMTWRIRNRVQALIDGFVHYAEVDNSFRFLQHAHNELGLISEQFNRMADEVTENQQRTIGLEKLASWQTIARKMAHEIKNPLTPIQIMIGQLKRNYKGEDSKYQTLVENAHKVILEEVSSLRRMVDDFSEFARLPRAELKDTDIVATAQKAADLAESAYQPHAIKLETQLKELIVPHDDQLLRHVIHNLIKNAAEADAGNPTPITVRVSADANHAFVVVHDCGPGVPDAMKERIFEAYVTTKHTGPTPGMGLGLAICQKVVLEHGGKLKLESAPGNTSFTITIPLKRKVTANGPT